jgi:EAL domain-containing protein (putative c-di-GMP-specific phosphodiesterase class I)
VRLSVDDFGIGYSSLSYLKSLPVDELKIDRGFVKDILTDSNDAAIATTIIGLCRNLGLEVIAEGVETEEQRDYLARQGCHRYQGFLYCKPLPLAQLEAFMQALPDGGAAAPTPEPSSTAS